MTDKMHSKCDATIKRLGDELETRKKMQVFPCEDNGPGAIVLLNNQAYELSVIEEDTDPREELSIQKTGVNWIPEIKAIEERLSTGDLWAWCTVKLRLMGTDKAEYLGQCNYLDAKEFITQSGYFKDMLSELEAS